MKYLGGVLDAGAADISGGVSYALVQILSMRPSARVLEPLCKNMKSS